MDMSIVTMVIGIIGTLSGIITTILYSRAKTKSVELEFPKSTEIDKGKVSKAIVIGEGNRILISGVSSISDADIQNLAENISVKDQRPKEKE